MDLQKILDRQTATMPPPRFLVLVPVGILFKPQYDGDDEKAALAAYWRAERLNQVPLFVERRRVVMG